MNLFRSFAFKNSILYLLMFFFAFGIFGFLLFKNSSIRIIETANRELQHRADLLEIQTVEYYKDLVSSLNYLTFNPILDNYLGSKSAQNYKLLSENYLSLLEANSDFAQIRYLDAESGMEVVRVDRTPNNQTIVNSTDLQNKKDRPYFISALNLEPGQIYISPIDLNKEYGKISLPLTPTLRLARLVYKNDQRLGVVVINIDLRTLFDNLKQTVGDQFSMQLLNQDGYYLVHENVDSTFLFEYAERDQKGINNKSIESNQLSKNNTLRQSRRIQHELMTYELVFNVTADRDMLLSSYYSWRYKSILIMLFTVAFLTVISFLLMNRQSKDLAKITTALRDFPKNRKPKNELITRTDEIGEMAKGFDEMASLINTQMDEITAQKLKAEEAFKDKSVFIENISHEIRNPLQSIMGLSDMLEKNNPNPNQVDILKSLKFNTSNLHGLVNNVLDYQNVLKGDIAVENSWSNVVQIIEEVVNGHKYAAAEKKIFIKLDLDKELPLYQYQIDRIRLSQIVGNLLSNAIKFTKENGSIIVGCHGIKNAHSQVLTFSVKDTGIGISESEVLRIKDRYFTNRGVQALSSSYGIGLTIVSELLDLYNSRLDIASEEGKGSEFSFKMKLDSRESNIAGEEDSKLVNLDGTKMLIIEDDKQIANLYLHILSNSNASIVCREDVEDLKDLDGKFDLIIADYRFARKSLVDVQDDLERFKNPETPLIIASASKPDISLFQGLFRDVSYIRKPFTNIDFVQAINTSAVLYNYGYPTLDQIKADYDYVSSKYNRALNLLFDEWKLISDRFGKAIETNDKESFEATHHKFVTTLKRLELHDLSEWLNDIRDSMPIQENKKIGLKVEVLAVLDTVFQVLKSQI